MALTLVKDKLKATRIEFPWSEGGFGPVAFSGLNVWRQASEYLREKAWGAPAHGGYDKTDFVITFEDGETYRGRFDLMHPQRELADLAEHVREHVRFHGGLYKPEELPDHITPEEYEGYKTGFLAEHLESFVKFYNTYEIGDEEPKEIPPPEGVSPVPYDEPKPEPEPEPEPEKIYEWEPIEVDMEGPEVRTKEKGVIKVHNIHPGYYTLYGKKEARKRSSDTIYCAEIRPKKSIKIYGLYGNHIDGPQKFEKTFELGDTVVYDSYNLIYTGEIVGIGAKTVSIRPYPDSGAKRLDLNTFVWRNWNLDLDKISAQNADTMMHI